MDSVVSHSMRTKGGDGRDRWARAQRTLTSSEGLFFLSPEDTIPGCAAGNPEDSEKSSILLNYLVI